jgi:pimeloyl-ACP methyl ester carboxylesterase
VATFVLIHGGGHGGWCYNKLSPLLRAQGHLVHAPSLTGCGDRKHLVGADVGLDTHVTDVANLLEYEDLSDVILLGHSYGGMVITGAADRAKDRIGKLVYLDAAHPRNHESLANVAKPMMQMARSMMRVHDGVELVLWPDALGPVGYFGVTDPDDIAWMKTKLTPHPWKCFSEKLAMQDEAAVRAMRRFNINCTAALANSDEEARARQLEGERNFEIDTGHDLMITEPRAIADMLLEIAAS